MAFPLTAPSQKGPKMKGSGRLSAVAHSFSLEPTAGKLCLACTVWVSGCCLQGLCLCSESQKIEKSQATLMGHAGGQSRTGNRKHFWLTAHVAGRKCLASSRGGMHGRRNIECLDNSELSSSNTPTPQHTHTSEVACAASCAWSSLKRGKPELETQVWLCGP